MTRFFAQILSPTIPAQLTSANAAIETLRPVKMFVVRFVEVGYEVTKEIAGTVFSTAAGYALEALSKSIEVIQNRGGATYNMLNDALVEFVEADIERNAQSSTAEPGGSVQQHAGAQINIVPHDVADTTTSGNASSNSAVLGADVAGESQSDGPDLSVGLPA